MPFISSVRGSYGAQGRFGRRAANLGLTSATAAVSAAAIKAENPAATDGAYWLQPIGCPAPFLVHCYMTIEGGGWQLVLRNDSNFGAANNNPFPSGDFLVSNWSGWAFNTKSQIDALGYSYSTAEDTNTFTPNYAYAPFKDVMVIANRSGQQSKRVGWRHNNQISSMVSVINHPNRVLADSVLFGNAYNWLQSLDVRSDTNLGGVIADQVGFKIRADGGSTTDSSNFTGGFWTSTMHYGAQIGCGRDTTGTDLSGNAQFGGGFGGRYGSGGPFSRNSGHWWNHGPGRSASTYSAGDYSGPFYGHAVYVRA